MPVETGFVLGIIVIIVISIVFTIKKVESPNHNNLYEDPFMMRINGFKTIIEFYELNKKSKNSNKQIKKLK